SVGGTVERRGPNVLPFSDYVLDLKIFIAATKYISNYNKMTPLDQIYKTLFLLVFMLEISLLIRVRTGNHNKVCGRTVYPTKRIVGGSNASFGEFPWQVSLRQWSGVTFLHKCGAALLNENWAVTAAHCVEKVRPEQLLLRLGEFDLKRADEPHGFVERIVQIIDAHPQFDVNTFEYDLALLRFYEPVNFQPNIIPVCIPQDECDFKGDIGYVSGWGRLSEG
ncbi:unnamed protein product, partial [Meganyctiphanes norvegica]